MAKKVKEKDIFDRIMQWKPLAPLLPFYEKYKSVLLYVFFGGLTTLVSIFSFAFCLSPLGLDELVANVISWILAVSFAYLTNRVWVFDSLAKGKEIFGEALSFYAGRLLTLFVEEALLLIFVTLLGLNAVIIKIIAQFVVLVLNYFVSKLLVFRKKED